ncbi:MULTISPECIES: FtsK/SpoIIIE domain-containing protein [unclassified Pseudonocardia]|uniref:FtsK/SpoIIIE domain-containing protein n=1 Tax=unclassified Pseudonocardia TaxID=2619320 RepID=UPI00094ADFC1|nr:MULTISPECIES: FtsK/SpoIIIE domain-containing protein [unclassified Pseudonocardia]
MNEGPQGAGDGETIEGTRPRYTSPGEHGRRPPPGPRPRRDEDVPEVVDGEVIDAEIVEDEDEDTATAEGGAGAVEVVPARRPGTAVARVARQAPARLVATTRTAVTHPYTRTAVTGTALNAWYVVAGVGVVARRWRDSHGADRYERMMRAAESVGDQESLREWEARATAEKARRHQRVMDWISSPLELVKAFALGVAGVTGLLLALGIVLAIGTGDVSKVVAPIVGLVTLITWTAWFLTAYGVFVLAAATAGGLLYVWNLGKTRTSAPGWIAPRTMGAVDENVTPSKVVIALRNLGVSALAKAIKAMDDAGGAMLGPIRVAGAGVEVDVRLPSGVDTSEIQRRRRKLAENLDRHEYEVFITVPAPRTVRLWVADSGALDEPIGPSPLLGDPDGVRADVYTGHAPWGRDLRGQARGISLKQFHLLITGLSNQGKTAALRALVLWVMFDVTAEFRIADLKGVGDWHMFDGLASELIEGPADEHVIAATEMLERVVAEMERRLGSMDRDKYPNGVTRDLARKPGSGFHPLFAVIDEAQQAYMCPVVDSDKNPYGGRSARSRFFMAVRKIHNQGRAVNVHLWQGTQDPTDQNLPKLVREGAHIRGSLVVGTESQARMAVGDKAVDGGAAPHLLRQGVDKGTLVLNGVGMDLPTGESSIILRTHFISGDEATELVTRAKEQRAKAGRATTTAGPEETVDDVDHIAVMVEVMGEAKHLKRSDLLACLHKHDFTTYGTWEAKTLAKYLNNAKVPEVSVKGYPRVRRADLLKIQADRLLADTADDDTDDDTDLGFGTDGDDQG